MFENLKDWQKSMELVEDIYKLTSSMPDIEKFNLVTQINRCAISIPSNIAEGKGRNSDKEFKQFLYISRGSLYELKTQIELAKRLGYIKVNKAITDKLIEIDSMLNSLIKKL